MTSTTKTKNAGQSLPDDASELGRRLRVAREEAGLTRASVEQRTRISVSSLERWERGVVEPPLLKVDRLAREYDVSIDWLVGRTTLTWVHKIDRGVMIVRNHLMGRFFAWTRRRRSDQVPEELIGPSVRGIVRIPDEGDVQVLDGEGAEALEQRVRAKIREL
ncbi:MAG: helix-turn-helix transcriptional regulator [Planctomycetota bacterium]